MCLLVAARGDILTWYVHIFQLPLRVKIYILFTGLLKKGKNPPILHFFLPITPFQFALIAVGAENGSLINCHVYFIWQDFNEVIEWTVNQKMHLMVLDQSFRTMWYYWICEADLNECALLVNFQNLASMPHCNILLKSKCWFDNSFLYLRIGAYAWQLTKAAFSCSSLWLSHLVCLPQMKPTVLCACLSHIEACGRFVQYWVVFVVSKSAGKCAEDPLVELGTRKQMWLLWLYIAIPTHW